MEFENQEDIEVSKNCGAIFVQKNKQFCIVCTFCFVRFIEFEQFTTHYSDQHFNENENEGISINLKCVEKDKKNDDLKINESNVVIEIADSDEDADIDPLHGIETNLIVYKNQTSFENKESSNSISKRTKADITSSCKKKPKTMLARKKRRLVYYSCNICGKDFISDALVKDHEKYDHLHNDPLFSPSKAGDDDGDASENEEESTIQSTQIKSTVVYTTKCRFCYREFKSRSGRIDHERVQHLGENLLYCKCCNKQFANERRLRQHEKYHSSEKTYKCNICDAAFVLNATLAIHLRRHKGEKNVACSYCDRKFFDKGSKIIHERTHTGERPFQCIDCGKCFITSSALFYHRKLHHSIEIEKPHKCEVCSKCFTTASMLKCHTATHSDLRPFTCEICNKSFKLRKGLRSHSKTHSNEPKYTCNICGKGFKQSTIFGSHMKSHEVLAENN